MRRPQACLSATLLLAMGHRSTADEFGWEAVAQVACQGSQVEVACSKPSDSRLAMMGREHRGLITTCKADIANKNRVGSTTVWARIVSAHSYKSFKDRSPISIACDGSTGEVILSLVRSGECGQVDLELYRVGPLSRPPDKVDFVARTVESCWSAQPNPCPIDKKVTDEANRVQRGWAGPMVRQVLVASLECRFDALMPRVEGRRIMLEPRSCSGDCSAADRPLLFYDPDEQRFGELQRLPWKKEASAELVDGRTLELSSYTLGDTALRLDYADSRGLPLWFGYRPMHLAKWSTVIPDVGQGKAIVVLAHVNQVQVSEDHTDHSLVVSVHVVDRAHPLASKVPRMDDQGRLEDPRVVLGRWQDCPAGVTIDGPCDDEHRWSNVARTRAIQAEAVPPDMGITLDRDARGYEMVATWRDGVAVLVFNPTKGNGPDALPIAVECDFARRHCAVTN